MSKFPVGTSVRVVSKDQYNKRTGEVVEVPDFPWRDYRRVRFDPQPEKPRFHPEKDTLVEEACLRVVERSARPAPLGQLALFEEAA